MPFRQVFLLFGLFIVACGTTHLLEVWTLWYPAYWLSGGVKAFTAFISCFTAIEIVPLVPQALALRSPAELEAANRALERQVAEREKAEAALQELNEELEQRVQQRTEELLQANTRLQQEIEERRQIEAALRLREIKFRHIFENSQVGIFQTRIEDGLILEANQRFIELIGYDSAAEVIGQKSIVAFYVNPGDRQRLLDGLQQQGEIDNFELEYRNRDGDIRWGLVSLRLNTVENCLEGVITDITERKRTEAALRTSEVRYRTLIDNIPGAVYRCLIDADWTTLFTSRAVEAITGYPAADFIHNRVRSFASIIHPDDYERGHQETRTAVQECKAFTVEYRIRHADGKIRWMYERAQPVFDEQGQPIYLDGTIFDITDRKLAEERFRTIFEYSSDAHFLLDPDGTRVDCNAAAVALFDVRDKRELLGVTALAFVPEYQPNGERSAEKLAGVLETLSDEEPQRFELMYRRSNGKEFPAEVTLVQIAIGDQPRLLAVIRDVTEQKRFEDELKQSKEAAEAANKAKSTFLANMSHELRTPLNAILGFSQLLTRDANLTEQQRETLSTINRSGDHLLNLINDVLDVAKIEAGCIELDESVFNLPELLQTLQEMLQVRAQAKRLQLLFDLDPNLPRAVRTDEGKLRQVLVNLLGNAIKFTPSGGVSLRVRYIADTTPPQLQFEVTDSGIGMEPEELAQLFQPFVQTASSRAASEGTGLGLAISREFVRLMGGEIQVTSQKGQGSTFAFNIKIQPTEIDELKTARPQARVIGLAPNQSTYRLLVVDDRLENRAVLTQMLTSIGFAVREASDGQEAVTIWQQWEPHLIWMDMLMPRMDGYAATRQIKANLNGQTTKVVALTANALQQDREKILAAGCDDLVIKPFREAAIFEILAQQLGVQYRYSEEQATAAVSSLQSLSPEDLKGMPLEWLTQLNQAVVSGDDVLAAEVVGQMPNAQAAVASALMVLIEAFRLDAIADLTQAALQVDSEPSQVSDSQFEGVLGRVAEDTKVRQHSELREERLNDLQSIRGASVLLVEDNVVNQQIARALLEGAGLVVTVAETGAQAIAQLQTSLFDLVLMDIRLPEMDGLETTRRIRSLAGPGNGERFATVPIIAMTAQAMPGDREQGLQAGMNDYVTKPIDANQLYSVLSRWIAPRPEAAQVVEEPQTIATGTISGEELPQLPGIDSSDGLARLGGNTAVYRRILKQFYQHQHRTAIAIQATVKQGDREQAARLAHSVKGLAANIGARPLSRAAAALEQALDTGETEQIPGLIDRFASHLREVSGAIASLEAPEDDLPGQQESCQPPDLDHQTVSSLLVELENALESDLAAAIHGLEILKQHLAGTKAQQQLKQLEVKLSEFDTDGALEIVQHLQAMLVRSEG